MILYSNSLKETQKIAAKMAKEMVVGPIRSRGALRALAASNGVNIIALEGELGAGKTAFVQAFVKALGVKEKVKSPTFNIIKKYKIPSRSNGYSFRWQSHRGSSTRSGLMAIRYLYHIDCYRLRDHKDATPIGIKEILKEKENFVLIEWPERISKILPRRITKIHIDHISRNKRKIQISKSR